LVGWHAGVVGFPLSDAILAQLACPLSDIMFYLHSGITNLPLYKHWNFTNPLPEQFGNLTFGMFFQKGYNVTGNIFIF